MIAQWSKIIRLSFKFYFVGLQLYSEGKLYSSTSLIPTIAFHIEATSLAENVQTHPGTRRGYFWSLGQRTELTEVSNPDSEEPKASDPIDSTEGKPRCIILLF